MQITLINVNDSPPTFDRAKYEVDISEAASVGQLVTTITADDPDSDSEVTYTITGTDGKFTITNAGKFVIHQSVAKQSKDAEVKCNDL